MTTDKVPEWMEYGLCETCEDLTRIENAYEVHVNYTMKVSWKGEKHSENQDMKEITLWCSQQCRIADKL